MEEKFKNNLVELHRQYFCLRFKHLLGSATKNHLFSFLRKEIARKLTINKKLIKKNR